MNIVIGSDMYLCHPKVIKFAKVGLFRETVLMVDGNVVKKYKNEEELKKDKELLSFTIGLSEPVCVLKGGNKDE